MVSLIICFYERLNYLKCCLDALRFCEQDFDEVIVTDDGSRMHTVKKLKDMIREYEFSITHVWQPKEGFRVAAARNSGIRHARGDYLVFLDCDFMALPDTIETHLKAAKPGRFVAGNCKYLNEEQTKKIFDAEISREVLEKYYQQIPEAEIVRQHRKFIKRTILIRLRLASPKKQSLGGHFSIHRKDIEYVNGYDENFIGWGGEDEDLGIRLVRAGIYSRSVIPYARVLHLWHPREIGDKHWREGVNIDYFKRKDVPFYCENGLNK